MGSPLDLSKPNPRRKRWTRVMYELAAEACHDKDWVLWEMTYAVDNGIASRQTWRDRRRHADERGYQVYPQGEHFKHHSELWRPGARSIAVMAFNQARRNGRIVVGEDGIVRLRGQ